MTQSCTELLEKPAPSTSISETIALEDAGAVQAVHAAMYSELHGGTYTTTYMLAPEALGDNSYNRPGTTRLIGQAQNSEGAVPSSWGGTYDLINKANLLISAIDEGVISQDRLNRYRGEAYVMRAFAMHHLVRALGYEPGMAPAAPTPIAETAGWNQGIIIRTEPVQTAEQADFRGRSTVDEVYAQIRSDLEQGISLLGQSGTGNPTYWTQAGAYALQARVELYARNWSAAESAASSALSSTTASLVQEGGVATMFDETAGLNPEGIMVINVANSAEALGVNSGLSAYTSEQWIAQVPTQSLMDLYSNDDARLAWYAPCFEDGNSTALNNCWATHPTIEGGSRTLETQKWNAEQGQYIDDVPLFRVSEMKLIQAEARINGAPGDPLAPFNELRQARGIAPVAALTTDDILEERRREFAFEGQRYWDLKRLGRDIVKDPTLAAQFEVVETVSYKDYIILGNLPSGEIALSEANAEGENVLVQNPGYE
ncbi:MAG: RagB/SusD family nutrient uptake outer membrane protein [Balneolaceae bacterium]|nr:RagB/SusD family nutrient uptake outer membrane protein [Balneolaceae bacterium]